MHAELKSMEQQKVRQPAKAVRGGAWQLGDAAAEVVASRLQAARDSPAADLQQLLCEATVALHLLVTAAGTPMGLDATWHRHGALHGEHTHPLHAARPEDKVCSRDKAQGPLDACCSCLVGSGSHLSEACLQVHCKLCFSTSVSCSWPKSGRGNPSCHRTSSSCKVSLLRWYGCHM